MQVSVEEAKAQLNQLLDRVAAGEEITIEEGGKPRARLVPPVEKPRPRKLGSAKGEFVVPPDFDDPLPDDLLAEFYK